MTRSRKALLLLSGAALLIAVLPVVGAAQQPEDGSSRLEWRLADLEQTARARGTAIAAARADELGLSTRSGGLVEVQVTAVSGSAGDAAVAIESAGGVVDVTYGELAGGTVSFEALAALGNDPLVAGVRPDIPVWPEVITGEGVAFTDADDWHAAGFEGDGVIVAIVDSGFANFGTRQSEGELPPTGTLSDAGPQLKTKNYCDNGLTGTPANTGTVHGTGVAEIVHEMAPGADLLLICVDGTNDMAQAITFADNNGAKILQASLGTFNTGRGDGTGATAALADDARSRGLFWVNSAGNYREKHWNGTAVDADADGYLELVGADGRALGESVTFTTAGGSLAIFLKWDKWGNPSACDLDLELWEQGGGSPSATSDNDQAGGYPWPEESITASASGNFEIKITNQGCATVPRIDLFVPAGPQDISPSVAAGSITGIVPNSKVHAVGAVCHANSAAEPYSSQGPTIDGRKKPDSSAPDAVVNASYPGVSNCQFFDADRSVLPEGFTGTSGAAPHTAGAAALILEAFPGLNPAQLHAKIKELTRDAGDSGHDNRYGAGILDLGEPPDEPGPGPDTCFGEPVTIPGTPGDDMLVGTAGKDVIAGGDGNDTIQGKGGNDKICGGSGNDKINGGTGDDKIDGEDGKDQAVYFAASAAVTVDLSAGTATGGDGSDTLKNIENVMGSLNHGDTLTGDSKSNVLKGLGGKDKLYGLGNIDNLVGASGNDTIEGGAGDDKLFGKAGFDSVDGGAGDDAIEGNTGNDTLLGGDGKDTIKGGADDDTLKGEGGNDTLNGGTGTDVLNGGPGTDVCKEGETNSNCEA